MEPKLSRAQRLKRPRASLLLRPFLAQCVVWALVLTAAVLLLPFLLQGQMGFLGSDVSSLAAGVMEFYPTIAIAEGLRMLGVGFALAFLAVVCMQATAQNCTSRWGRILVFPGVLIIAYGLWLLATVVQYPALFEAFMSSKVQRYVHELGAYASPLALQRLATLMLVGVCGIVWSQKFASTLLRKFAAAASLILGFGLPSLLGWSGGGSPGQSVASALADKPPVILLGVDSLRFDRLQRPDVTPVLQELLAEPETISFQDHYAGIPRTFPSWIEMLSGRYAASNGVRHMFPGFGERSSPFGGIAQVLKDRGYVTQALSDFAGDIFPRFESGFDVVDAPSLTLRTMIRLSANQSVPGLLPFMSSRLGRFMFPALKESPVFGDPSHLVDKALAALERGEGRPKFLTVFFSTAHFPYAAPYPYYRAFAAPEYDGPYLFQKNPELKMLAAPSEQDVQQVRALYDGALKSIDEEIGRFFAQLKRLDLYDRAVIIVTADHGEDLFENGMLQGHGEHLRGTNVLRIPLIIKLPRGTAVVEPRPEFTSRAIDLASTIADAAGEPTKIGEGISLLPYVLGPHPLSPPQLSAYAETGIWFASGGEGFFQKKRMDYPGISGLLNFDQGYSGEIVLNQNFERIVQAAKHRMILQGDYKLIYMPTDEAVVWELYDRRKDPENVHELSRDKPLVLAAMQQAMRTLIKEIEPKAHMLDDYVVPSL